jgi:hypothetical protein
MVGHTEVGAHGNDQSILNQNLAGSDSVYVGKATLDND